MEARHLVERLLDDESLTADLKDEAAKRLLKWGVARVEEIAADSVIAEEERWDRLADVRNVMKRINERVGPIRPECQPVCVELLLEEIKSGEDHE